MNDAQPNAIEHRLEQLEVKLAFQEETISVLNDVVTELRADLTEAQDVQRILLQRLRESDTAHTPTNLAHERPPHY